MPSWSKRALIRCAHLARDGPLLERGGLERDPHDDAVDAELLHAPHRGLLDDEALEVLVLPQVVGDVLEHALHLGEVLGVGDA